MSQKLINRTSWWVMCLALNYDFVTLHTPLTSLPWVLCWKDVVLQEIASGEGTGKTEEQFKWDLLVQVQLCIHIRRPQQTNSNHAQIDLAELWRPLHTFKGHHIVILLVIAICLMHLPGICTENKRPQEHSRHDHCVDHQSHVISNLWHLQLKQGWTLQVV